MDITISVDTLPETFLATRNVFTIKWEKETINLDDLESLLAEKKLVKSGVIARTAYLSNMSLDDANFMWTFWDGANEVKCPRHLKIWEMVEFKILLVVHF